MSFSYSNALASNTDWVRFILADTVDAGHLLEDEEIAAMLASQKDNGYTGGRSSAVYLAAAELLSRLHTKWMSSGKGVASKKVSRLTVVYGTGAGINIDVAMQTRIDELRARGARLLATEPYAFRVL